MDGQDLEMLTELTRKAANAQLYDIASKLKYARDDLKKDINDKWSNSILEQLKSESSPTSTLNDNL